MTSASHLTALALATAGALLLAGCAAKSGGAAADAGAPKAAAAAPSAPPAPPPPPPAPGYADIAAAFDGGNLASARQALVGKSFQLDLQRPAARNAPASSWVASEGDAVGFRCLVTAPSFRGGPVTAEVRAVRVAGKQKTVDLARCATAAPPAAAASAAPAAAPAAAAPAAAAAGAGTVGAGKPGMDARGNVVDSSKVEAGSGRTVKGLNGYDGEITGNPGPGSKFGQLQIGMSAFQVTSQIGPPTDQGAYMTGKAWIPFYFGADRHRFEMVYKGQGRLIFAGGSVGDFSNGYLIWIIHNPNEPGTR